MAHHIQGLKKINTKRENFHEEEEEPLSPFGAIFHNTQIDSYVLIIMGLKKSVHVPAMKTALQSTLSKHKRFSSIVMKSKNGNEKWVPKEFNIDDHIIVAEISTHSRDDSDFVEKYTATLATAPPLDPSIPLWQIHVLNFRSAEAEASVVFRIHRCIGDCVSLMSLFLDCTRKQSQPESMPTIRTIQKGMKIPIWSLRAILEAIWTLVFSLCFTALNLLHALATLLWMKDGRMVRGAQGVGSHSRRLAHVTVDPEDIAIVRRAINGTVNDVVTGMLSAEFLQYFNRLYFKDGENCRSPRVRAIVPVNIRSAGGLHKMEEMIKKGKEARWGNAFGMWILPIAVKQQQQFVDYCRVAEAYLYQKKPSWEAQFIYFFMDVLLWLFGWQAPTLLTQRILSNTTLVFSNVLGPVEQVQFLGNSVSHIVTTVSGLPQGLVVHFQSYAGKAKLVAMAAEDLFPEVDQLCMDCAHALSLMKQEALHTSSNNGGMDAQ